MPLLRTVALAAGLSVTLAIGLSDDPARADRSVRMTDLTAGQVALATWALELFDAAGLSLHAVDIVGHDTTEPCLGSTGAHIYAAGRSTVHICTREAGRAEEFLYLHELAHAWDRQSLTEDRQRAFLVLRGLTEWRNDDSERWHDRGAEHAAEIMTWGLMDRPIKVVYIDHNSCAELLAGYVALVGRPPLHGYTDKCRH
jgi:hypothetical protein